MALSMGRAIGRALRVGLAHHPLCGNFGDDVYRLARWHVCRGCALAFPSFVVGLLLTWVLLHVGASPWALTGLGLALGVPQVGGTFSRPPPAVRAVVKVVGGVGLGFVLVGLLVLPGPAAWRVALFAAMAASFVVLQLVRALGILATCRRCPWAMDWDHCPGFGGLCEPFSEMPGVPASGRWRSGLDDMHAKALLRTTLFLETPAGGVPP